MLSAPLPLFDFALAPLSKVEPWLNNGRRTLHWFALSQGHFWINAGSARLFEPRPDVCPDSTWEYYLARFWPDVLEMLPAILEAVPQDIARRLDPEADFPQWEKNAQAWFDGRAPDAETDILSCFRPLRVGPANDNSILGIGLAAPKFG